MERVRELASFWNWLPAFRVVAETQHLPTASKALNVTAPALSRSIKLLEKQVGRQLFARVGRGIELTPQGEEFLAAVRDGMRFIHQGFRDVQDPTPRGPVAILSSGLVTHFVIAALRRVRQEEPQLQPQLSLDPVLDLPERLLQGDLDIAFHSQRLEAARLQTERLGQATNGVYCGPGHPLHGKRQVTVAEIADCAFVAPPVERGSEGWPEGVERKVGMRVSHMHLGCEVCAQGDMLAVLPDEVAARYAGGGALQRLPFSDLPPTPLFATYRAQWAARAPTMVVLAAVREAIQSVGPSR